MLPHLVMILTCILLEPGPNFCRDIIANDNLIINTDYWLETSKVKVK